MTDEEKKAIEFIKSELQDEKVRNDYQSLTGLYGNLEIEIILNLIEKQSKEIEELKNGQIDFWISDKEIEESIEYLKLKIKNDNLTIQGMFGDIYEEIQKDNTAIETLLTSYEKEKEDKKLIEKNRKEIFEKYEKERVENKRLRKCHLQYEEMTGIDLLLPEKEE